MQFTHAATLKQVSVLGESDFKSHQVLSAEPSRPWLEQKMLPRMCKGAL